MRRGYLAAVAAAVAVSLTGCSSYTGINSLPLPGTVGTGGDAYQIQVELKNADAQVPNTPVLVDDINVGTVTKVALDGWTPVLTLSIKNDVKVPANAVATLGQTSLLGSKHIALAAPPGQAPEGEIAPGTVIKADKVKQYPPTEDVLAGVSLLLNGGGIQHFQTITTELNRAIGGSRTQDTRELLTQLDTFTGSLDKQKDDITTAFKSLDRLGGTVAPRMGEINTALQDLPDGLNVVREEEPALRTALGKLGDGAQSLAPFSDNGSKNLKNVLHDLEPTLKATGDIQSGSIPRALRLLPFVIFPVDWIPYLVRGDYANLTLPVNLSLDSLDKNVLTGTPAAGSLHGVAGALRSTTPGGDAKRNEPQVLPGANGLLKKDAPPSGTGDKGGLDKVVPGIGGGR
jgi:phospholipid/cholesterol/gamma-HCH transport system substrate-binding protein